MACLASLSYAGQIVQKEAEPNIRSEELLASPREANEVGDALGKLRSEVVDINKQLTITTIATSKLIEQLTRSQEDINNIREDLKPLRDNMGIFVGIIRSGIAVFAILVTIALYLWNGVLKQDFRNRVDKLSDEVKERAKEQLDKSYEYQNMLSKDFGSAALETLGQNPLREVFSAVMSILSLEPRNVHSSGCLNLRMLHKKKNPHTSLARPALDTALKNWQAKQENAPKDKAKDINLVIKDLRDTITELSQPSD
jgi:hypothetical protein